MDLQKDEDFEKAWQENRHIWESTKNLAKAMFYAGQAKAQAIPDGFILVPKEPTPKMIAHITNTPIEVNLLCDHADVFLSEDEACIAYKAVIEAQEPAND